MDPERVTDADLPAAPPAGEPPAVDGIGGGPMRGAEADRYGVDHAAAADAESPPPPARTSTWIVVALVLLVVFAAILAYGALFPATG